MVSAFNIYIDNVKKWQTKVYIYFRIKNTYLDAIPTLTE